MRCCVVLIAAACGCSKREAPVATQPEPTESGEGSLATGASAVIGASEGTDAHVEGTRIAGALCEQLPFAEQTRLPEASGAAWLELDGALSLVVVSDSGHGGAFVVLDPETGVERAFGKLPLGTGSTDDTEGLAVRKGRLIGLTSGGHVRAWEWRSSAFALVEGPYPIGSGPDVCGGTNCARDYEGLALAPESDPRMALANACVGVACARADGSAYCVSEQGGKLQIDRTRKIVVTDTKMALADCAFSETGALYAGNNLFGMAKVHRIDGWGDPASAKVVELESLGVGFPEVIAVRGDVFYRMSDTGGTGPSLLAKFRCPAPTR